MRKREFFGRLQDCLPPGLRGQPYDEYCAIERRSPRDNYTSADFQVAQDMIERFAISQPQFQPTPMASRVRSNKKPIIRTLSPKPGPVDMLTSDILAEKIASWAEGLRKRLFNLPGPPFDWNDAIKWIEQEAEKNKKPCPSHLQREYKNLANKFWPYDISLHRKRALLPYAKTKDPWRYNVYVNGPKLAILERETRSIAKATGFNQASLVIFILAGIKPLVARVQSSIKESFSRLPEGKYLSGKEINLTFRACDFSGRELQRLYKQIKHELKIKKSSAYNEKHFRVYSLIKEYGKPPARKRKGHFEYWIKASNIWKQRYKDKPRTWQGLRGIYERLIINIAI